MALSKSNKIGKLVSMVLVLVMLVGFCAPLGAIEVSAASGTAISTTPGTNTYSLFNSGNTGSASKYNSIQGSDRNPNSYSYNNSGYDIYGQMPSGGTLTLGMGLSFSIE